MGYVAEKEVLDRMPRKWHVDPVKLDEELDGTFAAGKRVGKGEVVWVL